LATGFDDLPLLQEPRELDHLKLGLESLLCGPLEYGCLHVLGTSPLFATSLLILSQLVGEELPGH